MTDDPTDGSYPGGPAGPDPATPDDEAAADMRLRDLFRAASETTEGDPFGAIYAVKRRVRRRRLTRGGLGACFAAAAVAASVVFPVETGGDGRPAMTATAPPVPTTAPPVPTTAPPYHLTGALVSFTGCTDYLDYVRSRGQSEAGPYGLQSPGSQPYGPIFNNSGVEAGGAVAVPAGGPPLGSASGAVPSAAPAAQSGLSPQATDYSHTNDQVAGVDEPDTVKTDGNIVVTLTGPTLRVLDTSANVLGSIELQGDTSGGFLLDGPFAVVLSSSSPAVYPSGEVYSPPAEIQPGGSTARAAVVDLSDPSNPKLVRTFLFDGTIVASRLAGGQIRLVDRTDGPRVTFTSPPTTGDEASATAANRKLIADSTLSDWLPAWQLEEPNGAVTARQAISSCDAVSRAKDATGISTISVFTLDPRSSAPGAGTSLVAAGDTVYATAEHLYVAGQSEPAAASRTAPVQYGCCTFVPPHGASTEIYAFDTPADGRPSFLGSGSVPGWLLNSYAMDEAANGLLRVATTEMTPSGSTDAQITVLRQSADQLVATGSVRGLGRGEVIRAVRFIGNDAYVVTYQSFDPLYVVDLSNPTRPAVAGELDQPGFSEFLYPLPGQRLLGVGVEITGNEPSGLVVATYDVSDPAHPRRIDSSVLVNGLQFGLQGYDPHAFLYWAPKDLALLAVPSDALSQGGSNVAAYGIGAGGKLTRAATLGHGNDLATRSVVIDGHVWVVTTGGVVTAGLSDLTASAWHPY